MNRNAKTSSPVNKQQSSSTWLQEYGLHANNLTLDQILPRIGFKQSEGTIPNGQKISSAYNKGLFIQHPCSTGTVYNITAANAQISSYEKKLEKTTELLTARIKWLNSCSCLQFGALTDERVCIIVCGEDDGFKYFDRFVSGVSSLITEQVSQLSSFNIMRCKNEVETFSDELVSTSPSIIEEVCDWLKEGYQPDPDPTPDTTPSKEPLQASNGNIAKAIVQASTMENVDSILLVAFGSTVMQSYSELKETVPSLLVPLNVSVFGVQDKRFIEEYQEIAGLANGRFHMYNPQGMFPKPTSSRPPSSRQLSRPSSAWSSSSSKSTDSNFSSDLPDGEVLLLWRELEESRNTAADLEAIQLEKQVTHPLQLSTAPSQQKDDYITSADWISTNGLCNNRLLYQDLVSGLAFQHCEGMVKVRTGSTPRHGNGNVELLANYEDKLVEAQYCKGFVHLRWIDGRVIHTHLEKRPYEAYKRNVEKIIQKCRQRREWLCRGSRELFGTVLEQNVIVLLDTSSSMAEHLPLVKRKLRQLALEQLAHKSRFTVMHFGTEVMAWKNSLSSVTPDSISSMIDWLMILEAEGSTNTLGALRKAVGVAGVEAIYLLTDGRPDQPLENVVQQLRQWRKVVVHTISFNCADSKANLFLARVAEMTGGRYHYYSENLSDPDGPVTHRSEDIRQLENEIELAEEQLANSKQLYEECSRLKKVGKFTRTGSNLERKRSLNNYSGRRISSLSSWIEANSLLARDLTLIDALGPSSVPHDPTHVDIIDKDVRGKVFEDIMSQAHISGDGHVRLINPNGVDIRNYVSKLDLYVKECQEVIMEFGVRKLPIDMERTLRSDLAVSTNTTLTFDNHFDCLYEKLTEIADNADTLEEIGRVREEIIMARQYRVQAESLLHEARRNEQQSRLLESTDGLLQSPSYCSTVSSGSAVSLKSDMISRQVVNGRKEKVKKKLTNAKVVNRGRIIQRGQHVACLHPEEGLYYPGIFVRRIDNNGFCEVKLAQLETIRVLSKFILPYGGSTPCPALSHGDFVLVRTRVRTEGQRDLFLPGVVGSVPGNPRVSSARYDVTIFGGKLVFCSRSALIRIELTRYREICEALGVKWRYDRQEEIPMVNRITSSINNISRREAPPINDHTHTPSISIRSSPDNLSDVVPFGSSPGLTPEKSLPVKKSRSSLCSSSLSSFDEEGGEEEEKRGEGEEEEGEEERGEGEEEGRESVHLSPATSPSNDMEDNENENDGEIEAIVQTTSALNVTIERGTSASPLLLDVGTCTGPMMVETGVSTLPETKEVATTTSLTASLGTNEATDAAIETKKEVEDDITGDQRQKDNEATIFSGDESTRLTIDMLATPSTDIHVTPSIILQRERDENWPQIGDQVLCRWADNGWYYKGMIVGYNDSKDAEPQQTRWTITDPDKLTVLFKRDEFFTDFDDGGKAIKIGDSVIGLHSVNPSIYAPAKVKSIMEDSFHLTVTLFDNSEVTLPRHEVYSISEAQYLDSVEYIVQRMQDWIGKAVIARSSKTGLFHPGTVLEHVKNSQKFKIKWANNSITVKNMKDVFGELTRKRALHMGDYVIALPLKALGKSKGICYPGQIVGVRNDNKVVVQMNNDSFLTTFEQCFWISQTYYIDIMKRMRGQ